MNEGARRIAASVLALALIVGGCGTTAPSAPPPASEVPSAPPSGGPTTPPSGAPTTGPTAAPTAEPSGSAPPTGAPSPTPMPSHSATTAPSQTAVPTPPALDGRWSGGTLDPRTPDSVVTDVISLGDRVVAVGRWDIGGSGAWASQDAVTWQAFESSTLLGLGVAAATVFDGRIVAVGRELDPERDVAIVVRSADGRAWTRDAATDALAAAQMIDVIPFGDGLVAVGSAPGADAAAVWIAPDGATWERVPVGPSLEGAFMWTVAGVGPGLIAGGWRREADLTAGIWTSVDGRTWSVAPAIEDGTGMQIRGVAGIPGGYVAVGELIDGGRSAAWTSSDGGTWTRVDAPSFEGASVSALLAADWGLVAVGSHDTDDAAVWISRDGTEWTLVDDPDLEDAFLTSVTTHRGHLVAGGATQVQLGDTGSYDIRAGAWSTSP